MQIAIVQLNYKIGDFDNNYAKIETQIKKLSQKADLIIFSELCLSGYYPMDLIDQPSFVETQNTYLKKIEQLTDDLKTSVVIGFIDKNQEKGKPFHNSLCLISHGKRLFTYHKRLLPVYNIFDEARHFAPGKLPGIYQFQNIKIGFLICEDGWAGADYLYEGDPVDDLSNSNLDLIVSINGSPSNIGKQTERIHHFSNIAKRCHASLIFCNQVGANDDIVFDGTSFVVDKEGLLQGCLAQFKEDTALISIQQKKMVLTGFNSYIKPSDAELFYQQTLLGLQDYIQKCGFKKVVLGVSGGIDSAITLALAVKAIGHENVLALAMPSRYSSASSLQDAKALCDIFNVALTPVSIEEEFTLCLAQFEKAFHEKPLPLTEQNIQARLRGRILMEYSNQTGALVLSTGNKSELSVGYTTLYGDMTGGFNLIGDLYKTQVYELVRYFNQIHPNTPIPAAIIHKIPSAELAPNQKDSDTLPEYEILDPILKIYIEGDLLTHEEYQQYKKLIANLSPQLIQRIHKMVDSAEFKRRQSAPIVRVQRRAFGYGRQLPIAATYPKN
ncbi:MAG: NAD+ synthase [Proteobacteria bacterium]|nr:NAD+ synthase [Pseudomonadota bacterium]